MKVKNNAGACGNLWAQLYRLLKEMEDTKASLSCDKLQCAYYKLELIEKELDMLIKILRRMR